MKRIYYHYQPRGLRKLKAKITLKAFLISLFLISIIGTATYKSAFAFFSDVASSVGNTFSAAATFPGVDSISTPTPTPTDTPPTPTPTGAIISFQGQSSVAVGEEFTLDTFVDSNGLSVSGTTMRVNFPSSTFLGVSLQPGTLFSTQLGSPVISVGSTSGSFGRPAPITPNIDGIMSLLKLRATNTTSVPEIIEYDDSTVVAATETGSTNAVGQKNPFLVSVATPSRTIVINEIMWSGSGSIADEWIELRNTTNAPIDLASWKIVNLAGAAPDNIFEISSGTIPANGYFLISNYNSTNASSILNVSPDVTDTSVNLNNDGEQLVLRDATNTTIDVANISAAWFAGVNSPTPKKSMERNATPGDGSQAANWHTATTATNLDAGATELATPKAANSL